jgi:hypothetical protein
MPAAPTLFARNGIFGCGDRAAKITARDGKYPQRQKRPLPTGEIPAQTAYQASTWKSAVRKDWVVEVVGLELETHHPVFELVSVRARY